MVDRTRQRVIADEDLTGSARGAHSCRAIHRRSDVVAPTRDRIVEPRGAPDVDARGDLRQSRGEHRVAHATRTRDGLADVAKRREQRASGDLDQVRVPDRFDEPCLELHRPA